MSEIINPLLGALATAIGGTLVAWLLARVRPGRLGRTLDQANKLVDFVQRYCTAYDGLAKIGDAKRSDIESLLVEATEAVREDFAAERTVLPKFEKSTGTVRGALLLSLPDRTIGWPPFIIFYTMLLFMLYLVLIREVYGGWQLGDAVALFIAGAGAVLARLTAGSNLRA